MPQIIRPYNAVLAARMLEPRRFIQVLVGPRQVGKTTLVRQVLADLKVSSTYVSADNVINADSDWLATQWDTARKAQKQHPKKPFILAIDEIQKIENWSETVKRCWDEDTANHSQLQVIILGSSRLLVQQGLTESLAGRFEKHYICHWNFSEMNAAFGFSVDEFLWFGGYPGSASLISDEPRWKSYVLDALIEPAISKDILMLTRVDKPTLMRRLFELGCGYSGQILSYTKLLGQLADAGNTTTLSNYLNLLENAGLLAGLEKFSQRKAKQRGSSPKFLVQNNALFSAYNDLDIKAAVNDRTLWGRVVESAVGGYLFNASFEGRYEIKYWREGNEEVDFVLSKGKSIVCIEVKSGIGNSGINNKSFMKQYPKAKNILVGGQGIPLETFLKMNPLDLF